MSCHHNVTEETAAAMNVCSDVHAAVEAASAIAESEPHNAQATIVRLYNQMRRSSVISAVKYELTRRNNQKVAERTPGVKPLLLPESDEYAIHRARTREAKLLDVLKETK